MKPSYNKCFARERLSQVILYTRRTELVLTRTWTHPDRVWDLKETTYINVILETSHQTYRHIRYWVNLDYCNAVDLKPKNSPGSTGKTQSRSGHRWTWEPKQQRLDPSQIQPSPPEPYAHRLLRYQPGCMTIAPAYPWTGLLVGITVLLPARQTDLGLLS